MIRFSIVIPVFNRARYLETMLRSVYGQTYRPLEVILVDNGSTDGSLQMCHAFAGLHDNSTDFSVKVLSAPEIKGASHARNVGTEQASGTYIYFFDSDDEMSADFFDKVAGKLKRVRGTDLIGVQTFLAEEGRPDRPRKVLRTASVSDHILTGTLSTQAMVFRTDFYRRTGGWNEALPRWNDWELGVRTLLLKPRIEWLEGIYHRIRIHPDSITGSSFSEATVDLCRAIAVADSQLIRDKDKRALRFRQAMLAALCYREGNRDAAKRFWNDMIRHTTSAYDKMVVRLLYLYIICGGKGAWLIARWLL